MFVEMRFASLCFARSGALCVITNKLILVSHCCVECMRVRMCGAHMIEFGNACAKFRQRHLFCHQGLPVSRFEFAHGLSL